jgi:hypothetical protein
VCAICPLGLTAIKRLLDWGDRGQKDELLRDPPPIVPLGEPCPGGGSMLCPTALRGLPK